MGGHVRQRQKRLRALDDLAAAATQSNRHAHHELRGIHIARAVCANHVVGVHQAVTGQTQKTSTCAADAA